LLQSLLAVLLLTIGIGSALAFTIVRPLKKLQNRSLAAVKEFSGKALTLPRWGNEIDTLSRAVELMLFAVNSHLHDLQQAQETIRQEKIFLDNVFTSIQDGLRVLDLDFTILRSNPVMNQLFHDNQMVGKKCYRASHGKNEPCENCPCRQAIETGMAGYQSKPVLIDGIEKWIEIYAFPLRDQDTGKITGVIEYARDVTAAKATENALRQRDEQFIVDIDLSSFGLPWEAFMRDGLRIRAEFPHVEDDAYYPGHLRFLRGLCNRPSFFFTDCFRQRYERTAHENIRRLVADLYMRGYD
jgi:PAS domain S-box-containing protein